MATNPTMLWDLFTETGFIVDREVVSNYCAECTMKTKSLSAADFATWKLTHNNCQKNYDGTSNSLECEAATCLWNRSQALGLQYTTFVGDGDCNTHKAIQNLNDGNGLYGVPVVKEESLNHVSKRLGTRLRALKKNMRISQPTKTGKNIGCARLVLQLALTDKHIDKLVKYYANNIYSVGPTATVQEARNAILSTYYHGTSTDADQRHSHCPAGANSWCWVQRAKATGEVAESHTKKTLFLSHLP